VSADQRIGAPCRDALIDEGLDPAVVLRVIATALDEDLDGGADVTSTATIDEGATTRATVRARASGTLCGIDVAAAAFEFGGLGAGDVRVTVPDGASVAAGDEVATVEGDTRTILMMERTALNLLCHLSGVATATSRFVDALGGSGVSVRDTRKTTPGLRALEKYAVRCGGGVNHRTGLYDAALVKDNHVAAAGSVTKAVESVRAGAGDVPIEIEVDSIDQLEEAMAAGAEFVLLDNMDPETTMVAVARARVLAAERGAPVLIESSGHLDIDGARRVAATGVDFVSIGSITHSAPIVDFGLDFD
jgi:nicotinate-nucleotide pyrophosphorylase (carboxylating)